MKIPNDPNILLSYVNTKLRDFHPDLQDMCKSSDIDEHTLVQRLSALGYEYDPDVNRFV